MTKILCIALLLLVGQQSFGVEAPKKPMFGYGLENHFYFPVSFLSDLINSPMELHVGSTGRYDATGQLIYAQIPYQRLKYNFITGGIGFRHNLIEFNDNLAIGLIAELNVGMGPNTGLFNSDSSERFVSMQLPILVKLYFGNTATYASENDRGFSVGFGIEVNKLAFGPETNFMYNRLFLQPCTSLGFIYKKEKDGDFYTREFNIKVGVGGKNVTTVGGDGLPYGDKPSHNVRSLSIKLAIVFLPYFN